MKRLVAGGLGVTIGLVAAALVSSLASCLPDECGDIEPLPNGTYQVKRSGLAFGAFVLGQAQLVHSVTVGADQYVVTYDVTRR